MFFFCYTMVFRLWTEKYIKFYLTYCDNIVNDMTVEITKNIAMCSKLLCTVCVFYLKHDDHIILYK